MRFRLDENKHEKGERCIQALQYTPEEHLISNCCKLDEHILNGCSEMKNMCRTARRFASKDVNRKRQRSPFLLLSFECAV